MYFRAIRFLAPDADAVKTATLQARYVELTRAFLQQTLPRVDYDAERAAIARE